MALFALTLCFAHAMAQQGPGATLTRLADLYVAKMFEFSPESATFFGAAGGNDGALSDNSAAGVLKWQHFEDSLLTALNTLNPAQLSTGDRITYGILHEQLAGDADCEVCKTELWSVDQVGGWQINFTELATIQPVGTNAKRNAALSRWSKIPQYIRNEISKLKIGLSRNYSAPKTNVSLVITQIEGMITDKPEKSPFYAPALADTDKVFDAAINRLIADSIAPALKQYREYLQTQYLPAARTVISIAALPNGAVCYRAMLHASTTLSISPEGIYDEGVQAIADREAKTKALGLTLYGTNDLDKINQRLNNDTSNNFKTRDEITAYSTAAIARAQARLPLYFHMLPKATVAIKAIPVYEEQSGYPHYEPAPDDGSRPGTYYIDLYAPEKQNKGDAEVTAFHETYPGHHLQMSIARELMKSSPVSKYIFNSGYVEGWARYCETLADEMGLYSSDLNRLKLYSQTPTGMVVDPGIHFKGWTREQAIAYTLVHQPSFNQQQAESYVDRIAIEPAQMTSYGVGELQFKTLRRLAETQLGTKFKLKAFHDQCLNQGTVPLDMLSSHINDWINKEK